MEQTHQDTATDEPQISVEVDEQPGTNIHVPRSPTTIVSATPSPDRTTPSIYDDGWLQLWVGMCESIQFTCKTSACVCTCIMCVCVCV